MDFPDAESKMSPLPLGRRGYWNALPSLLCRLVPLLVLCSLGNSGLRSDRLKNPSPSHAFLPSSNTNSHHDSESIPRELGPQQAHRRCREHEVKSSGNQQGHRTSIHRPSRQGPDQYSPHCPLSLSTGRSRAGTHKADCLRPYLHRRQLAR